MLATITWLLTFWTRARFTETTSVYLCPVNPPDANWHFRCGTEVWKALLQGVVKPIMFTRIFHIRSEPFERRMGVMFRMVRRYALYGRLSWSITAQEDQNTRVTYSWTDHGNWQSTYSVCNNFSWRTQSKLTWNRGRLFCSEPLLSLDSVDRSSICAGCLAMLLVSSACFDSASSGSVFVSPALYTQRDTDHTSIIVQGNH
jgi:hypothetical protein